MKYISYERRAWDLIKPRYKPFVDIISADVLREEKAQIIQVRRGICAVRPGGEIVAVVSRGNGKALIEKAVKAGGRWLWCFDMPELRRFYIDCGFHPAYSLPFDRKNKPKGWSVLRHGLPDFLNMQLI